MSDDKVVIQGVTYTAGDIRDKAFIAPADVPVYGTASLDFLKGYYHKGQFMGVLESWLNPDPSKGRDFTWFRVVQNYGTVFEKAYYFPVKDGFIHIPSLKQQGLLSDKEKAELENKNTDPIMYYAKKLALPVGGFLLLCTVVYGLIQKDW